MMDAAQSDLVNKSPDQMTCSHCLRICTNPKSLSCLHFFCQRCVKFFPICTEEDGEEYISCPTCAVDEITKATGDGGVARYDLEDVYHLLRNIGEDISEEEDVICEMCTTANAEGYCKDCCQFLCQECDVTHKQKGIVNVTPIQIVEGFNGPCGIAASNVDGQFMSFVTDTHGITILDKEGKKIKSFSTRDIKICPCSGPHGIAITPDNFILVTDQYKIHKISMDGKLIASVGQLGTIRPLDFCLPRDITISPTTGQIYVADCTNRIQVLNPDLTFSFMFGREGSAKGQFQYPYSITFDNQGIVYVSDSGNHRIQKFTSDGKFLSTFGKEGSRPGQLESPRGILIANNLLYVVEDGNHRVSVFSGDGKFIRCFGSKGGINKDQFDDPSGITIDNEAGCLYICDSGNNRLLLCSVDKLYYCQ